MSGSKSPELIIILPKGTRNLNLNRGDKKNKAINICLKQMPACLRQGASMLKEKCLHPPTTYIKSKY